MPTPEQIIKAKQALIDARRAALEAQVGKAQARLLKDITDALIGRLQVKNGMIQPTLQNQRILDTLNELYNTFQRESMRGLASSMAKTYSDLATLNTEYFSALLTTGAPMTARQLSRFNAATEAATQWVRYRVGLKEAGLGLLKGGFLDQFVTDSTARNRIAQYAVRSITGGMSLKEFTAGLSELIVGAEGRDGVIESYARTFAYDTYQEFDAVAGERMADALGLRCFIYQGGLIEDSREFCEDHNSYVYTREEAELWREWTPAKAEHKEFPDAKRPNEVPSYISRYPGYNPLHHRGGFNCRHALRWITDAEAIRRRPELEEVLNEQL